MNWIDSSAYESISNNQLERMIFEKIWNFDIHNTERIMRPNRPHNSILDTSIYEIIKQNIYV